MKKFDGKRIYITGGSSGIGLATARILAGQGAHIAIFSRSREKRDTALADIRSASVGESDARHLARGLDVASSTDVERVINKTMAEFGPPDLLINSAGISRADYFENIDAEAFDRIIQVNLYGTRHTIAAVLPAMKQGGGGHIVNVASVAGYIGVFGFTGYSASKFAVVGLSEALRGELRPHGIGVSVLCPPDTDTPMLHSENRGKPEETLKISEGGGLLTAEAVARATIEGIRKNRFMIIPGAGARMTWLAKRFVPGIVFAVMDRDVRKVQRDRGRG
jgi:3-dehydrosphinganine reductase